MDLGLERAGLTCRWQVEIDDYCSRLLAKHWPEVKRYRDVRTVQAADLESVDLICGGFPCQPVSVAGRRKRQDDERWLWPEFARIVRDLRPRWVLIENVPGLLSGDWADLEDPSTDAVWRSGMSDVLGELARCRYDAEWDCIPAAALGAPHLRYRTFIVAYPAELGTWISSTGQRPEGKRTPDIDGPGEIPDVERSGWDSTWCVRPGKETGARSPAGTSRSDSFSADVAGIGREGWGTGIQETWTRRITPWRELGRIFADAPSALFREGQRQAIPEGRDRTRGGKPERHYCRRPPEDEISGSGWWASEPHLVRMVHGVPHRVDRIRGLGNAVIPQVAEWIGCKILEAETCRAIEST
jgi:DNA (cytosine-5)-methyltransferase 1